MLLLIDTSGSMHISWQREPGVAAFQWLAIRSQALTSVTGTRQHSNGLPYSSKLQSYEPYILGFQDGSNQRLALG